MQQALQRRRFRFEKTEDITVIETTMLCPTRLALIAATLMAMNCAQANTIGLHLVSYHTPEKRYNNVNPGIYYRTNEGWTAGIYRNSLSRRRSSARLAAVTFR